MQQVARYVEIVACILVHEIKAHQIKTRIKTTALFKGMICLSNKLYVMSVLHIEMRQLWFGVLAH